MMHYQFIKQPNLSTCGPTAMWNALSWAGVNMRKRDLRDIAKHMFTNKHGTSHQNFDYTLRNQPFFRVRLVRHVKQRQIDKHLDKGGIVVLSYRWGDLPKQHKNSKGVWIWKGWERHFDLITYHFTHQKNGYIVVNGERHGPAEKFFTRKDYMKTRAQFRSVDPYSKAWFLTLCKPKFDPRILGPRKPGWRRRLGMQELTCQGRSHNGPTALQIRCGMRGCNGPQVP